MKVLLFGATGMVGQGVLRECLDDVRVERVAVVVRTPTRRRHPKLVEIVLCDLVKLDVVEDRLVGFDACFYCVGVPVVGHDEREYTDVIYTLTMRVATLLVRLNPDMTFVYVSGAGTDASEQGGVMWARVRGRTENALQELPFRAAYMFRPGAVQPLHGVRPKVTLYRVVFALTAPAYPLLSRLFPNGLTTSEKLGRAMIEVAAAGYRKPILETADINAVA